MFLRLALAAGLLALAALVVIRPSAKEPAPTAKPVPESKPSPSAPAAQPPLDFASAKSIAVLPFENQSDDKENTAFFSDGMHEDILTNLANIRELRVVSRTSVMESRGTTKKIPQIAKELGVAYILEGSVRRAGNQVRITGQLIRAANDEHLWAKSYDRELAPKEIFAIQAALSTEIAGALRLAISPQEKSLVERRPTENLAAYDLYLKARAIPRTRPTLVVLREQVKLLQAAVDLDPNFAEAWGELAAAHATHVGQDYDHTPARLAQADAAIARAVRLAPDVPEVIRLFGSYAVQAYRDYPRATAQFEKVIRLQPNNAEAIYSLGNVQRRQGRWAESVVSMEKAVELEPGNARFAAQLAFVLVSGRRWGEALAMQRRVVALLPESIAEQSTLVAIAFSANGSTKEADDWLARLAPAQRDLPRAIDLRKSWAAVRGDHTEWKRLDGLQPYLGDNDTHWSLAIATAMILAAHGEMSIARSRLENFPVDVRSALELEPANAQLWGVLARMEAFLGQKEEALRDARRAVELMPETLDALIGPRYSYNLAVVCAWTGDKDRAIAEIARLPRIPSGTRTSLSLFEGVHSLRVDAAFAPLRGDSRFEALLNDPKNNAPLF